MVGGYQYVAFGGLRLTWKRRFGRFYSCYGTSGEEVPLVTLEANIPDQSVPLYNGGLFLFGRQAASVVPHLILHGSVELVSGCLSYDSESRAAVFESNVRLRLSDVPQTIADSVVAHFPGSAVLGNPLFGFTDAEIWAEVIRRGLVDESDPDEGLDELDPEDPEYRRPLREINDAVDNLITGNGSTIQVDGSGSSSGSWVRISHH